MIPGIYSAGSALEAATLNHEVTAENLAHGNTPGYRRHGMRFEVRDGNVEMTGGGSLSGVQRGGNYTDFETGPLQRTGNPLEVAMVGDAFFALQGPNGPVYTRNGAFVLSAQGELQSGGGLNVRSQGGGRIVIPPNTGRLEINAEGGVLADGNEVGRLELAQFADNSQLNRAGTTLFDGPSPRQPAAGSVRVEQGYREGSNVQLVQEMVNMMMGMRQYEAAERALKALGDSLGQNTRPTG